MANHPHIGHLLQVGESKAMGLLTLREIAELGHDGLTLARQFNARSGYSVRHFAAGDRMWGDVVETGMESLAVIHMPSLQKLLDGEKDLLKRLGWPQTAPEFAARSFEDYVLRDTGDTDNSRLQALIKRAYDHPYAGEKKSRIRGLFGL